ncbi:AMP-binding protein [Halalkalibacterium halodurans]|uniref:AMP-binding protein n=1 Tax=Halalkalibacterium halodurans TaxID=86665 RepID=UPI001419FF15|nr:AMP-binding protein [Halalkalibacterium halodurans]
MNNSFNRLTDVILSKRNVHDRGITFIKEENIEHFVSYHDLLDSALSITGYLQQVGIKPGDEVVLQTEDVEQFVYAYWACILGGFVPVPLSIGVNKDQRLKLLNVWEYLNNPFLLTNEKNTQRLVRFAQKYSVTQQFKPILETKIIIEQAVEQGSPGSVYTPEVDDVAMIQFSSGSTGRPKGVALTHLNVMTNIKDIISVGRNKWADDRFVSWLPMTHDFGLIALHLFPLTANANHMIMPTQMFIMSPLLWLRKASEYKATCLASPNFGYQYLLKYLQASRLNQSKLDLSSVRYIFNSAEQISPQLARLFVEALEPYNLKRNVIVPAYGLAEASVAVTVCELFQPMKTYAISRDQLDIGSEIQEVQQGGLELVDLGKSLPSVSIRVCDDQDNDLGEDRIGHIQMRGKNVTKGYYNSPERNEQLFTHDGYLRTGDIGFIKEGSLVITGRKKDLVIINGQNLYPYDIERVAEEVEGLELNTFACTSVYNDQLGEEEVIGFLLHRGDLKDIVQLAQKVQKHIKEQMGVLLKQFIPVKNIPRTTSGKIQRYQLAKDYVQGVYDQQIQEFNKLCMHESTTL